MGRWGFREIGRKNKGRRFEREETQSASRRAHGVKKRVQGAKGKGVKQLGRWGKQRENGEIGI